MKWKEQFDKEFGRDGFGDSEIYPQVREFISKKIVEKLIADIPDSGGFTEDMKQQLRDKWL